MRTEEIQIFTFDELSDSAKENAREWYRGLIETHHYAEFIYEDAERVAEILGIDFDQKRVPLMNGETRLEPKIWFSGFWSQGDGACFEGSYSYAKGAAKRIREFAPNDETLHEIADSLQAAQRPNFYRLAATCSHSGHYYHSGCMSVSVEDSEDSWRDIGNAEDEIQDAMRAFADWIYGQLEAEYEHQTSDETVDENILINEYEFTANGKIH